MSEEEAPNLLPIANVGRIMKRILPPHAKISKEAKERMQECASEFISFVTGEASDKCNRENRKTVNGDDICWALSSLGFDNYWEAMSRYLLRYREYDSQRAANHGENKLQAGGLLGPYYKDDDEATSLRISIRDNVANAVLEEGTTTSSSSSAKRALA